jgi:hypothetical protein
MTKREERKAIINSYIEGFLDSLEEDFDGDAEIGVVALIAELSYVDDDVSRTAIPYFCSDERKFVQFGLFTLAARIAASFHDPDQDDS